MGTVTDRLTQLRAAYLEMPGLRLNAQQAERLYGIEQALCQPLLDALVDARFLYVKYDGTYARASDEEVRE